MNAASGQEPVRRLFFALWPDADTAGVLQARAQQAHDACGGRVMRLDTLHLTLAFLGAVGGRRIPALRALLSAGERFGGTLVLDRFGYFRGPRIVWAGSSAPVSWLHTLHERLWADIEPIGLARPAERFRPHISLLRKVAHGTLPPWPAGGAIIWRAQRLVLVASTPQATGACYEVLGEQRLPMTPEPGR